MAQANAYPNQKNYGNMPQDYIHMVRFYPNIDSFYTAIMWGLVTQVCRHKKNQLGKDLYEKLNSSIMEFPSVPGTKNLFEHAKNLSTILQNALYQEIADFELFLCPYSIYLNYSCRCLLALICLKKNFSSEIALCLKPGTLIDESKHLSLLSSFLNIAIEVINSEINLVLHCEGKPCQTRILISLAYLGGDEKEFAVACNRLNDTFALNPNENMLMSHPFAYNLPVNRIPSSPSSVIPVQSNANFTLPQAACELLKWQLEYFSKNNWEVSQKEADVLKILIKKLPERSEYAQYKKNIRENLKKYFCDHSQKAYFQFRCGRKHCIECFKEEITLKSLQAHQIFCSCKKPLSQEEIKYFFDLPPQKNLENIKSSNQPITPFITDHQSFPIPSLPNGLNLQSFPNTKPNLISPSSSFPISSGGIPGVIIPQNILPLKENLPILPMGIPPQIGPDSKLGLGTNSDASLSESSKLPPGFPSIKSNSPHIPEMKNQINLGLSNNIPSSIQNSHKGHSDIDTSGINNQSNPIGLSNLPPLPSGITNWPSNLPPNPINQGANSSRINELPKFSSNQNNPVGTSIYVPGSLVPCYFDIPKQTGTLSTTKVKFCEKCSVPINSSNLEELDGKFYHKNCLPGVKK
ncbi:hypothetical protein SteCoe_37389 [Stentor coeruleus]|uniref:Uncharacterized protein n=1 Tax=Stentor coeruleus TaxID=5963 RepID=A0A1R2AN54_9CILI|nr:hypothetical protein SteCoe_37389 [Stentor coeruleus]